MKLQRRGIIYLLLLAVFVGLIWMVSKNYGGFGSQPEEKSYSQMVEAANQGHIKSAEASGNGSEIDWSDDQGHKYKTVFNADFTKLDTDLASKLHLTFKAQSGSSIFLSILPNIIFLILIGAFMWYMLRQTQSGNNQAMSFGRSRARMLAGDKPLVTFQDVAGVEEAKQELTEVVDFLKFPDKFTALGARIPKGVLLVGPPGTGKTLLSKAVAGEAGVPFFSISGSEFVEMFVGVGASRVRDLFDQAKKNAPCIVFVDEIDAVGRQRGAGLGGGHDEREQTLNQLLVEMDGFETNTHVIVIAATNRPDVLDPALLRPGRFDRHVTLDRPDIKGRLAILLVHAKNKPLEKEVELEVLAKQTPGFSGADLSNLINEAAILAARNNKKLIGMPELEESIIRVMAGPERKSRVISEREKNIVAYHEVGHALVAKSLPNADPVHKVSVISRGQALGWTSYLPEEDRYLASKGELEDRIAMALGGRVAEEIMFGEITSGAGDDIRRVTDIARKMVTELGMSTKLGPRTFGQREEMVFLGRDLGEQRNYSEGMAGIIDDEIHSIVDNGYKRAKEILTRRKNDMIKLAEYLKEVETMDGDDLDKILRGEMPTGGGLGEIKSLQQKERKVAAEAEKKAKDSGRPGFRPEPSPGL
ncbi:MAG TPA: ATP-dependent zinc metalloprotease FtsH [Candidatus Dormibacteraeota bacterium]|jgi:cell division protease FtsH|nr:ATP-dependent zinc metalloprotease FtsH [Candidatus Dormibacteraeota bacterium]